MKLIVFKHSINLNCYIFIMNNIIYCKDIYTFILSMLSPLDILNLAKISREVESVMLCHKDYTDIKSLYDTYRRVHLVDICNHGFIHLVKYLDPKDIESNADVIFGNAINHANFGILDFIKSYYITPFTISDTVSYAIKNSMINILEWLYKNNFSLDIDQYNIKDICCRQNVKVLDWLKVHNQNLESEYAVKLAAENGMLTIIKWYDSHNYITNYDTIFATALYNSQLDITDWLIEKYQYYPINIDQHVLACVTYSNHFSLEWLHKQYQYSLYTIAALVYKQGKTILLDWLKTNMHFDFTTLSIFD